MISSIIICTKNLGINLFITVEFLRTKGREKLIPELHWFE